WIAMRSSSRATRTPESELSATRPRHSRLKSSTKARMRKRRPSPAGARHSDRSLAPVQPTRRHDAANSSSLRSPRSRLSSASRASEVFSKHLFQRRHIERRFRQQLLQLPVLLLESLQLAGVRHLHPAILRTPVIKRRIADPMLAANIRRRHPSLMLLQNPDDLLFRKS